jgi:hypothetical protein
MDESEAAWTLQEVIVPTYESIELAGAPLKIFAIADRPDRAGPRSLSYENRYAPVKSQCIANVFLNKGLGWVHEVTGQQRSEDGRKLTVSYASSRL